MNSEYEALIREILVARLEASARRRAARSARRQAAEAEEAEIRRMQLEVEVLRLDAAARRAALDATRQALRQEQIRREEQAAYAAIVFTVVLFVWPILTFGPAVFELCVLYQILKWLWGSV